MRKLGRKIQKRIAESVRLVLIAIAFGAATLSLNAQAITCPITDLVTLTTADTNSVSCQITETGELSIQYQGGTLSNLPGARLSNDGLLMVYGSLANQYGGSITNSASLTTGQNSGLIINYGSLYNGANGTIYAQSMTNQLGGTFYNHGSLDARGEGNLINHGTLYNQGKLTALFGYGPEFSNDGVIINYEDALLEINFFYNESGGTLSNYGTIENRFSFHNRGSLYNRLGGVLDNKSNGLHNIGTLTNDGTLIHNCV